MDQNKETEFKDGEYSIYIKKNNREKDSKIFPAVYQVRVKLIDSDRLSYQGTGEVLSYLMQEAAKVVYNERVRRRLQDEEMSNLEIAQNLFQQHLQEECLKATQ
jgi:hypothetical protein